MRFCKNKFVAPLPIFFFSLFLIIANPLNIPRESMAQADGVTVTLPEPVAISVPAFVPVLVERTPEASKEYAKTQLHTMGWDTPAQWSCLVHLWTGESNWRPAAYNKQPVYQNGERLHAGGIPQILGLDPNLSVEKQIERGFLYISARYDTPCNAWRHFLKKGWH